MPSDRRSSSSSPLPNAYSRRWFATFLGTLDLTAIEREVAFLTRQLPSASVHRVLDLCCGTGRHLAPLSGAGYDLIGLDRDTAALRDAQRAVRALGASGNTARMVRADMRSLPLANGACDAVICMWQSFGQFDAPTNHRVLAEVRRVLRPRGRFVLDLYHREYHERRLQPRSFEREGTAVEERRNFERGRLKVELHYRVGSADGGWHEADTFEWQLYTPIDLAAEAPSVGLELRVACAAFDERRPASAEEPRMQLVFEASDPWSTA